MNVVNKKYEIIDKLGEGTFGKIYKGKNKFTDEYVAIKFEKKEKNITIKNEAKIYLLLKHLSCIPKFRAFGRELKYNYLIIDLLDKSLEDIIRENTKLKLRSTLLIGMQIIKIIEKIHSLHIIHRDIKPENFMFEFNDKNKIKIIDFGLSRVYYANDKHLEYKTGRSMVGTIYFISVNVHDGCIPSRRDDMESIGYILIYMLLGRLPWHDLKCNSKEERNEKILQLKLELNCKNNIPKEIVDFIIYCRELSFFAKPDYNYLYNLLNDVFERCCVLREEIFI